MTGRWRMLFMGGTLTRPARGGKQSPHAVTLLLLLLVVLRAAAPSPAQPGWADDLYGDPRVIDTPATPSPSSAATPTPSPAAPRVGLVRLGPCPWNWQTMHRELLARSSRSVPGLVTIVESPSTPMTEFLEGRSPDVDAGIVWIGVSPPGVTQGGLRRTDGRGFITIARPATDSGWDFKSQAFLLDAESMGRAAARRIASAWNGAEGILLLSGDPENGWVEGLLSETTSRHPDLPLDVVTLRDPVQGVDLADLLAVRPRTVGLVVIADDRNGPAWAQALRREDVKADIVALGEAPAWRRLAEDGEIAAWILPNYGLLLAAGRGESAVPKDADDAVWLTPTQRWADRLRVAPYRSGLKTP